MENRGLFGSEAKIHRMRKNGLEECYAVSIPLPGEHMVYNALAAASVGRVLGLNTAQIQAGISSVKPVGGRSNIIRAEKYILKVGVFTYTDKHIHSVFHRIFSDSLVQSVGIFP